MPRKGRTNIINPTHKTYGYYPPGGPNLFKTRIKSLSRTLTVGAPGRGTGEDHCYEDDGRSSADRAGYVLDLRIALLRVQRTRRVGPARIQGRYIETPRLKLDHYVGCCWRSQNTKFMRQHDEHMQEIIMLTPYLLIKFHSFDVYSMQGLGLRKWSIPGLNCQNT